VCALAAAAALAWFPGPLSAGPRDHRDGFFLRLSAGGGAAATEAKLPSDAEGPGDKIRLSGTASDVNIAIGAIVAPNLALHGTLYGWLVDEPEVEVAGASVSTNADLDLSAFGAGLTYYFMPVNIYLSGSLGFSTVTLEGPFGTGETDTGPALDITAGKEWWVSNRWALGVAAGFGYHSAPDKATSENWNGTSIALRFSATMN
jgi:hypothetical protein